MLAAMRRLSPFGPIFRKELLAMSRRKRTYALRFGYLGILLFLLFLAYMSSPYARMGTRGVVDRVMAQTELARVFFGFFAVFSVVAMGALGPVLTCTAINAERLNRTLNVLLLTPLNAWQIVAGKLTSRLLAAFTLLGLSLPLLAIVRLLGGVEVESMIAAVLIAGSVALASASVGLLLSAYVSRAYSVILLSYGIMLIIYVLVPILYGVMLSNRMGMPTPAQTWVYGLHPMIAVMELVAGIPLVLPHWGWCVGLHVGASIALTAATAGLVRRHARMVESATRAEPAVWEKGARGVARDVGENPVLWRELRRPIAKRRWQRIVGPLAAIGLLLGTYILIAWDSPRTLRYDETHIAYAFGFQFVIGLMLAVFAATAVAHEKETDTWTLLIASPLKGSQILWGKWWGVWKRALGVIVLAVLHLVGFALAGVLHWSGVMVTIAVMIGFTSVWVATGLYLSLKLRRVTTAAAVNLLLPVAAYLGVPLVLLLIGELTNSHNAPELSLWYLPFYYIGIAIDRAPGSTVMFEPWGTIDYGTFIMLGLGVATLHMLLALCAVWMMAGLFDRLVGRAPQTWPDPYPYRPMKESDAQFR